MIIHICPCTLSLASRRKVKINVERGRCRNFFERRCQAKAYYASNCDDITAYTCHHKYTRQQRRT